MSKFFLSLGTGPGIGYATAKRFAKEGYTPVLAARTRSNLEALALEMDKEIGVKPEIYPLDVANPYQVLALQKQYSQNVAVIHYNAAIVHAETLEAATLSSLHNDINVGITGALYVTKVFYPDLVKNGAGTILLTGGCLTYSPHPDYLALGIAKAGIHSLAHALFEPCKEKHIHIACVNVTRAIPPKSKESLEVAEVFWKLHAQSFENWTCEEKDVL